MGWESRRIWSFSKRRAILKPESNNDRDHHTRIGIPGAARPALSGEPDLRSARAVSARAARPVSSRARDPFWLLRVRRTDAPQRRGLARDQADRKKRAC